MENCTKFVATNCQILRLKCTKFDFGWGSAGLRPRPRRGSSQRFPDPLAGFKGPTSKGGEGRGREGRGEGRRKGEEEKGEGGGERGGDYCLGRLSA